MMWIETPHQHRIGPGEAGVVWRPSDPTSMAPATRDDLADAAGSGGGDRLLRRRALRTLASAQLEAHPQGLEFTRNAQGAPRLKGRPDLYFSASCRDGAVAVAMGAQPIGVDVERIGPPVEPELDAMAPLCAGLDFAERWAVLEAVAKALQRPLGREPGSVRLRPTPTGVLWREPGRSLVVLLQRQGEFVCAAACSAP